MKKVLIFIIVVMSALVLLSCSNSTDDPLSLAKTFDESGFYVRISVDEEDLGYYAEELKVRRVGMNCIVRIRDEEYGYVGYYIYCDDKDTAKKMVADLEKYYTENLKEDFTRGIIERKENVVFVGCEDFWGKI